jgi:hypothetical protein
MTKNIRIENGDTSDHKVAVYLEDLVNGEWVRHHKPIRLDYPTAMDTACIHDSRRLVIEEVKG